MKSGYWLLPVTVLLAFLFIAMGCAQIHTTDITKFEILPGETVH